jgi:preprotein translocase SecE subunit
MSKLGDYIQDTRGELKHVSWPTQRQAIIYTALVVAISIIVAAFVGAFDFVFTRGIDWFIK